MFRLQHDQTWYDPSTGSTWLTGSPWPLPHPGDAGHVSRRQLHTLAAPQHLSKEFSMMNAQVKQRMIWRPVSSMLAGR